jgi:molecular chaperone GrpE (heat shock protein)
MTEEAKKGDAEITLGDLASRIDELTRDVRRQGRAAVAAQAAAESCLQRLAEAEEAGGEGAAREMPDAVMGWVHALLPVADALDRILAQARAMAERRPETPAKGRGLWARLRGGPRGTPSSVRDPELRALAEGLRVLRAQLAAALETCDVVVDRRVGVPVDPEVHRVIEVRAARAGEPEGVVVEVVRPGYAAGGRVVREAEVVAAASLARAGND